MKQTSKIIGIDNLTGEVVVYSSKGTLSTWLNIPRETIVNWFRLSNRYTHNNVSYYKVRRYISKEKE